jgi:2-methylcitrate dehydratase PrpD
MGLDQAGLAHAQGVVLSMASGSMEFLSDGAWTKRMHPGWAGVSGLTATARAGAGFRGP